LHKGTLEIINGNLDYKVGNTQKDEIGELSRTFDLMTSELKETRNKFRNQSLVLEKQLEKSEKNRIANLVILNDLNKMTRELKGEIRERKHTEEILQISYNISNAVNTANDLQELYKKIKSYIGLVIDTTNFYIALYDRDNDLISIPFQVDEKEVIRQFPAGKSLTKYVIDTQKPLLANEKKVFELSKKGLVESIGPDAKIWLGVPLMVDSLVIGVIAVQSYDDPNLYSEKDIDFLSFVSEEIGKVIHKMRIQEQIKKELVEKNALIQEIYHRTKNNMMVIFITCKVNECLYTCLVYIPKYVAIKRQ
jgi:transcriptional regulator with GAF, ATPase, and Fis domain